MASSYHNPPPQQDGREFYSPDQSRFWRLSKNLKPEIELPGFWESFQTNCGQWADDISVSPFWKALKERQPKWSNDFRRKTSGSLLATSLIPPFVSKSEHRVKGKMVQKWISEKAPENIAPYWSPNEAPIPAINDLVRTRIECQFVDGVEFFAKGIAELAKEMSIVCDHQRQGRLQGYFAQHFCFQQKVIFRFGGSERLVTIDCEVQIATALATRIWEVSHAVYEEWRLRADDAEDWQWNPSDPRFTARQLGHMIHLADGLLVQLRNSAQKQK